MSRATHIAVCDDNVADRKQIERLLKRISDEKAANGSILYTDSFGHAEPLLATPMQYDAFFIDVCHTEGTDGAQIVRALLEMGIHTPIILCCSLIDYRAESFPDNVLFLEKPIIQAQLAEAVSNAISIKAEAPTLIELRTEKETLYVTEPEVVYAVEDGHTLMVYLTEGRQIKTSGSADGFFATVEAFPSFFCPTVKEVINGRHITHIGFLSVTLSDGSKHRVSGKCMDYARYAFREFQQ